MRDFAATGDLSIVKPGGDDFRQVADDIERIERVGKYPDINAIGLDRVGARRLDTRSRWVAPNGFLFARTRVRPEAACGS
jgi:phage terminase large subunit-like protein